MTDNSDSPLYIFFLDCLDPDEAKEHDILGSTMKGKVQSGIPRVTPKIVTEITTGKPPTETGILCPTRLHKDNLMRPLTETLFETLSNERRVLNYETPFTMNLQGMFLTNIGSAPQVVDQQRPGFAVLPRPGGQMWKEPPEKLLQGHVDYVRGVMSTMRNLGRRGSFDVLVPTIRNIDSFGHFYLKDQRKRLIRYVDFEMKETLMMGDMDGKVLWFSDHGIREKKETFYINRWLEDKGYLETKILYNKLEKQREQQEEEGEDTLTQVGIHSPFCEVSKDSQAISPDSYDSGIKILDDSLDVETLKDELIGTGFYETVATPQELYGAGEYSTETLGVNLVLDRVDGVMVSGNLHRALDGVCSSEVGDVHCQGEVRTGVHTRHGAWGCNDPVLNGSDITPIELHDVIKKFVRRNAPKPSAEDLYGTAEMRGREERAKRRLEDLGYI